MTTAAVFILGALLGAAFTTTRKGNRMSALTSRLLSTRRRKVTTAAVSMLLLGAGTALAAWLLTATGPGSGKIGSPKAVTVTATAPSADAAVLMPGSDGDLTVHLDNPNGPLKITSYTTTSRSPAISGLNTGCSSTDFAWTWDDSVNSRHTFATPIDVPQGAGDVILPHAVGLKSTAASACQGSTFSISGLTLNLSS
jgi:hypothetical protein